MQNETSRRTFLRDAALGAGAVLSGCGGGGSAPSGPPSVVLLVLDTVRAASCSAWGHARNTTPHLEAFAAEATRFERAISTAPWTLPSHMAMFTGQYTCQHGVRGYLDPRGDGGPGIRDIPAPAAAETLAERLARAGYATAGFTANDAYLGPYFQLNQGFETYHANLVAGVDMVGKALEWLDSETRRPFFLFCNLMDAHSPYNLRPCPETLPGAVSQDEKLLNKLRAQALPNTEPLDRELAAAVTAQYERGIANADRAAGMLLRALQDRELYDGTLLIVASDHGEFLGEHMLVEHSKDVYEETIHVPLLVKRPDQRRGSVERGRRSLVQVAPTVLGAAGLARPTGFPPGLFEPLNDFPLLAENYYARDWDYKDPKWGHRFDRIRMACYHEAWKYIHSTDGNHELYHLERDPGEQENQAQAEPATVRAMQERHARGLARLPGLLGAEATLPENLPEPSEEDQDALRALGYL